MNIEISIENSLTSEVSQILDIHLNFCKSATPSGFSYALDSSKLFAPSITVFGARVDHELVGIGALKRLEIDHGELKSMHTLAKSRGMGIGKALVAYIETFAKNNGITRISLETGTHEPFRPARELYESLGYENCDAFGDYVLSEYNMCMTKLI